MRVAVAAAVLFAVAWPVYDRVYRQGGDRPLAARPVVGALGGLRVERATARVFRDAESFLAFTGRRHTDVDFERKDVIFLTPGPRSSTAYGVVVRSIVEERSRIVVTVEELGPAPARRGSPRVTFPDRLIAVPATGKDVHVAWVGR